MNETTFHEKEVRHASTTLRGVVENRIKEAIQKHGAHAADAWERIKEQGRIMQDYIVPVGSGGRVHFHQENGPSHGGYVQMVASDATGETIFAASLHDNALTQLGEKLGIPGTYLRDMATGEKWQRERINYLLNGYAANHQKLDSKDRPTGPENLLVRLVGPQIRGVLSDRYKRLDTTPIFKGFITQGCTPENSRTCAHIWSYCSQRCTRW